MTSTILEQRLGFIPITKQGELQEKIDVYTGGISQMYSGTEGPPPKFNSIGSQGSGFQLGAQGNIRLDLGDNLQERYDFSGHNNTLPHLNYDILNAEKKFSEKALGDSHQIYLKDFKK